MEMMILDSITCLRQKKKRPSIEAVYDKIRKDDPNMHDEEFISTFKILEEKKIISNIKPNDNYGSYRISEMSANESLKEEEDISEQLNENKFIDLLRDTIELLKVEMKQKNDIIKILLDTNKSTSDIGNTTKETDGGENINVNENNNVCVEDIMEIKNTPPTPTLPPTPLETSQQQKTGKQVNIEEVNTEIDRNYQKEKLNNQLKEVRKELHQAFLKQRYPNTVNEENNINNNKIRSIVKEKHHWKDGTVLITGDSTLNGMMEKRMGNHVKVRAFPGARIEDMSSYLIPLLKKRPGHIILHVCTNDSTNKDKDADTITGELLNLKEYIEETLPETTVILSLPITRMDNIQANNTLIKIRENIRSLNIDIINNDNISRDHLGKGGLHLNAKGLGRLAMNFISYTRRV